MYRAVKLPFKDIFKNDDEFQEFNNKNITKINTAMIKVNKITMTTIININFKLFFQC